MTAPSIGRVVHYRLSEADVADIDRLMPVVVAGQRQERNPVREGDVYPAFVVRAFDQPYPTVNLQVMLDGAVAHWVTSRVEGEDPGNWFWPPRV